MLATVIFFISGYWLLDIGWKTWASVFSNGLSTGPLEHWWSVSKSSGSRGYVR